MPSSTVYDRALTTDDNGTPWPMNDGKYPTGRAMTVKSGITSSVNTIAVQVLNALTPQASYDFMTQRLGFQDALVSSRTNADGTVQSDINLAPLALGGLTDGVTVREMAGGFASFINEGVYGGTRTYTKVTDADGNTVLENNPSTDLGFRNVRTAYYMLDCLQNVTAVRYRIRHPDSRRRDRRQDRYHHLEHGYLVLRPDPGVFRSGLGWL